MSGNSIPERVSRLEIRMDTQEDLVKRMTGTLLALSSNITQIKWIAVGALVATLGKDAPSFVLKLLSGV